MATLQKKCKCVDKANCPHPLYDRVQKNGRRRWICLGTNRKTPAKLIADKKSVDRALKEAGLPVKCEEVRLVAFLHEEYLKAARADHPATADTKDAPTLARFLRFVKNIDIREVTSGLIDKWRLGRLTERGRGRLISRNTVNREMTIVRRSFNWAVEQGWLEKSPADAIDDWDVDDAPRRILRTPREYQVVRDMPAPYNVINQLTQNFLPRLAEVCALQRDDLSPVHSSAYWVEVTRKGGRRDKVSIDREFWQLLHAQLKTPEQQYLFPHTPRRLTKKTKRAWTHPWIPPANVSNFNTRYFRAHGMAGVCNHGLRHTGTTMHLTELHTDASTLQVMGGWENRRMLDKYGHASEKSVQQAAKDGRARVTAILKLADKTGRKRGPRNGPAAERQSA